MTPVAERVFESHRTWQLTHQGFLEAANLIATHEAGHRPDAVVGIARGGAPLADLLAELLHAPAVIVHARHNASDAIRLQASGHVRLHSTDDALAHLATDGRLLLVDDICGSGSTLRTVGSWLTDRLRPSVLRTTVLCRNRGANFTPDSWGWTVADWVRFPWEPATEGATEPLPPLTALCHPATGAH
ncbi:phosphoribosyltransferase family protein [Kitasatospora sp. NPDC050463]|uniref:phosphoribosyltransferase n=1 Tax=Kitasatospora sp. NPDC050463 TaxID=3155786 RepID=UPI0033E6B6AD